MVLWFSGSPISMVLLLFGSLVLWFLGSLVLFFSGALVHRFYISSCLVLMFSGPIFLRCSSSPVLYLVLLL